MTDEPVPTASERWSSSIDAWSRSPVVAETAGADRLASSPEVGRSTHSTQWAREVLPPTGGTVLDVGCGGGHSSLPLVPPASELVGVDPSGAMLDAFVAAAAQAGVARRTFHGTWPEIAPITPVADVAICHHVVYEVVDLAPFLVALTAHARLAVVIELMVRHPMTAWNEAWAHFRRLDRPSGPGLAEFLDVARDCGFDPEVAVAEHPSARTGDPGRSATVARRRLGLPPDRDDELAAWLAAHPPAFVREVATVRWAGEGEV